MKIETKALAKAIELPARLAGKRSALAVLNCLLLDAVDGMLVVTGSNLDVFATERVPYSDDAAEGFPVCVRADLVVAALGGMGESVELKIDPKTKRLVLSGDTSLRLSCQAGKEFPEIPKAPEKGLGVNAEDLAKAIKSVAWACSEDPGDYVKSGVFIECGPKSVQCVASNGRLLANRELSSIAAKFEAILNADFVSPVVAGLSSSGASFAMSENLAFVTYDSGSISAALTAGTYPNWRQVVPKDSFVLGRVEREPLLKAVRLAWQVACSALDPKMHAVNLTFSKVGLHLKLGTGEHDYEKHLPGKFADIKIAFGAHYLSKVLASFEGDSVELACNKEHAAVSAMLFRDKEQTCVLMPMRLS